MVYFRCKGVKAVENLARPASEDDEAYQSHVRLRERAERQAFMLGEQAKARAALKRQVREDREVWHEVDQEYSTVDRHTGRTRSARVVPYAGCGEQPEPGASQPVIRYVFVRPGATRHVFRVTVPPLGERLSECLDTNAFSSPRTS